MQKGHWGGGKSHQNVNGKTLETDLRVLTNATRQENDIKSLKVERRNNIRTLNTRKGSNISIMDR